MKPRFPRLTRSRLLAIPLTLLGLVFVGRLFYLQILRHEFYVSEARSEHTSKFTIPAARGTIYAHDGPQNVVPLVLNEPAYTAYADSRYVKDVDKTMSVLRGIAGGTMVKDAEAGLRDKERVYVVLARMLSQKQATLLKEKALPGVGLQKYERRVYPEGQLAAQVLGYVNADEKGQYGLEQALNDDLAGKPGTLKTITDVNGIPLSVEQENILVPAQDGKSPVLTIDRNVQTYVELALKKGLEKVNAKHGSALILNPNNGAIVAMANSPTFDPRAFSEVKADEYNLFSNATVSDPYEAGSVIKTLTMATGLNEGVITSQSTYNNTGSVQVDDALIKNVLQVNGSRSMTDIFQYSLNTGAVHILQQLGGGEINQKARDKLYHYFSDQFGFGRRTGIEQSTESPGTIIAPNTVQGNDVRYANMTFGQGMDTTMIQVAAAFAATINGGTYYKPHLVGGYLKQGTEADKVQPEIVKAAIVTPQVSANLRTMLRDARAKTFPGVDKTGYIIGGKTGTSQTIDPKTGKYTEDNAIGSYVGYGGVDTPEYVIMIRVMDAKITGYAGSVAVAPIFADISNWLLDYLKIQPKR